MKYYQKLDGGVLVSAREYDIASDTVISEGQVVKLSAGLVTAAAAGETGAVLGVAAESHGVPDALNLRANCGKIKVIDDPDAVYQCAAPQITAASGTATTLSAAALKVFSADDFNGGFVKLVSKAENSANTDVIGQVRRVTDFSADGSAGTLTLESGGTPSAGDVYALFPPVGFAKGNLNSDGTAVVLTAAANLPLKVVGRDCALGKINLMAGKHLFAVNS